MSKLTALMLLIVAACVPACTDRMELPANFVELDRHERGPYDVRGISADGVVVALRHYPNPKGGSLEFWSEAIRNELTRGRGYTLEASEPIESASGVPGQLMTFAARRRGAPAEYVVGVFVTSQRVLVAEAGGKKEALSPRLEEIRTCLLSARSGL